MIHAYLAWTEDPAGSAAPPPRLADTLERLGCPERWRSPNLALHTTPDLPLRTLEDGRAVLIGRLFDTGGREAPVRLAPDLSIREPSGLVDRYWGAYVAFASDGVRLDALRDPSGGLACYHVHSGGRHYFTSMPHLLVDAGAIPAEIDWTEVAAALTQHSARGARTALRQFAEILPATRSRFEGTRWTQEQIWTPWRFAHETPPGEPAAALEAVLASTLSAWGRTVRKPLIEISGGLDSAVVAAGIAPAAEKPALITFAAAPGDPDETLYAKAIAERLGLPLEIASPDMGDVDLTRSLSADLPRPNARAFTQAGDALSLRHAQMIGADAFVSGGGGDDVFCYLRSILPAVDRLQVEGWRAAIATASDIAMMNHDIVWTAGWRLARRHVRGTSAKPARDLRFLSRDLAPGPDPTNRASGPLPGKAEHVRGVMTIHNYLEGHARSAFAPILSPLLSQPIVECCLKIPTWLWCAGGRNRAVARSAFQSRLPQVVIDRRSKGAFDAFSARLLHHNCDLVRNLLLEGQLSSQGMLDRPAIDSALRSPSPSAEQVARLLALVDVEAWTTSWSRR